MQSDSTKLVPIEDICSSGVYLRTSQAGWCITLVALLAVFSFRLDLFQTRGFNPDEFEHLHAAWCDSKGSVAYKDFFEHHTPWFYYLLKPLVKRADQGYDSAVHSLVLARGFVLVIAATALAAVVWVGWLWSGLLAGLVAALLLAGMPMFLDKTIEIRPDVPAMLMWMWCLAFLMKGARSGGIHPRRRVFLLVSGLCLGGAIMFTQKMLFTLPGLGFGLSAWILWGGDRRSSGARARVALYWSAGLLVPIAATWGLFATQRAGFAFIYNNFLLNARWQAAEPPQPFLERLAGDSWPVLLLCVAGVGILLCNCVKSKGYDFAGLILLTSGIGLLLGLLIIPVAMAQYYLMLLPLVALFAGHFVAFLADRLPPLLRIAYLTVGLALLQITPVEHALNCRNWRNAGQLAELRFVMDHAAPTDTVIDGWRGLGVFRPHAWYYYFLHPEVRGMLGKAELRSFLEGLESGTVRPKLVVMDNNLRQLSERFVAFVGKHYDEREYDIWVRKPETQ